MYRLIDAVHFHIKQGLTFRGYDERKNSLNRGNNVELLKFLEWYDDVLPSYFSKSAAFTGTSTQVQNDLVSCISSVMKDTILA